jgi:hypothetical protein
MSDVHARTLLSAVGATGTPVELPPPVRAAAFAGGWWALSNVFVGLLGLACLRGPPVFAPQKSIFHKPVDGRPFSGHANQEDPWR